MKDILEGINKVIAGPQKKSRLITERDKRITAYHEAGHALVGRLMKHCDNVQEVSIIPRGMAAGYTISRPRTDDSHVTKNRLNDEIAMLLGGRASEEIIIQDISTGASQDIKRATSAARSMVTEWGMSDALPNVFFGGEEEVFIGRDYQTQASYSDEIAAVIDKEIKSIIDYNYKRAYDVVKNNLDAMHAIVRLLFEHETIYGDEIDLLLEGKSVEEVNVFIEEKRIEQEKMAKERAQQANVGPLGDPSLLIVPETVKGEDGADVDGESPIIIEITAEDLAEAEENASEEKKMPARKEETREDGDISDKEEK